MAAWEGLMPVADANYGAYDQGNALRAEAALERVNHGLLPSDLSSSPHASALTDVLNYLHRCGY